MYCSTPYGPAGHLSEDGETNGKQAKIQNFIFGEGREASCGGESRIKTKTSSWRLGARRRAED